MEEKEVMEEKTVPKTQTFEATESSNVGLQFDTQVGVAICPEKKSDSRLKQPNLKHRRIAASFGLCPDDLDSINNVDESDNNNVNEICEPHVENVSIAILNDILSSEKNSDLNSINDSSESRKNKAKKKKESNKESKSEKSKETKTFLDKPIVLRYKENQWSPLNPEGKKQYDRDFLLQLQAQPYCLIKPRNLPNVDIIKDKARIQKVSKVNRAAHMPVKLGGTPRPAHPTIKHCDQQGGNDKEKKIFQATESSTVGLQFDTQVGVATCPEKKSDSSQPNLKHRRIAASFVLCPDVLDSINNVDESDNNNVNEISEPLVQNVNIENSNDILSSEKNSDLNSINDSNESRKNKAKKKKELNKQGKSEELKETKTFLVKPIVLRYKENQWSPLNPEGKKQYDRDFLLQLQAQPYCLIKPRNLPNVDIIKDKAHIQKVSKVNRAARMPVKLGGTPRPAHPTIKDCDQQGGNDKKKKKFDFAVNLNEALQKPELTVEEIRAKLRELLLSKENKEIIDWIDTHTSASAPGDVNFIRLLTYEVHKGALIHQIKSYKIYLRGVEKYELDLAALKTRIPLLNRYINHNKNSELQTLYEIQQLMNELRHPKGVLRQIFYILYDDDVISKETFKKWEQSKDPDELEGKGVAMLSVRGFFTSLQDCE